MISLLWGRIGSKSTKKLMIEYWLIIFFSYHFGFISIRSIFPQTQNSFEFCFDMIRIQRVAGVSFQKFLKGIVYIPSKFLRLIFERNVTTTVFFILRLLRCMNTHGSLTLLVKSKTSKNYLRIVLFYLGTFTENIAGSLG